MNKQNERVNLVVWNRDKITLRDISKLSQEHNPNVNACQLAKMIMSSFPGNAFDIFLNAIASEILPMLETQEKIDILNSPYDIQNRVRGALSKLAYDNDNNE